MPKKLPNIWAAFVPKKFAKYLDCFCTKKICQNFSKMTRSVHTGSTTQNLLYLFVNFNANETYKHYCYQVLIKSLRRMIRMGEWAILLFISPLCLAFPSPLTSVNIFTPSRCSSWKSTISVIKLRKRCQFSFHPTVSQSASHLPHLNNRLPSRTAKRGMRKESSNEISMSWNGN